MERIDEINLRPLLSLLNLMRGVKHCLKWGLMASVHRSDRALDANEAIPEL